MLNLSSTTPFFPPQGVCKGALELLLKAMIPKHLSSSNHDFMDDLSSMDLADFYAKNKTVNKLHSMDEI